MHFLKEGQKIRAWVNPPPIIRAMPERKRFFSIDVFPYGQPDRKKTVFFLRNPFNTALPINKWLRFRDVEKVSH